MYAIQQENGGRGFKDYQTNPGEEFTGHGPKLSDLKLTWLVNASSKLSKFVLKKIVCYEP